MSFILTADGIVMSAQPRTDQVKLLVFERQIYAIEQIVFEADEFCVVELGQTLQLNGREERYLAVTKNAQLFTIDALAAPNKLLIHCHGCARIISH
ncbi:MAG: hypothetical protein CMI12_09235 [Oceanospirillum sp.]|nr:hypothetical protein [Oceanospirillum sp.]